MIGTTIKDFKLVERLGKGGWGEVWAAEQPIVKTRVAIKLLRPEVSGDEAHVRRFFNEAIAVGSIPHAGIVKIFDVGFVGEQAFLIMELLDGEALTTRIRRVTRLPLDEVIDIGRQIGGVLAATHDAGIVHRDLKPDNVFLVPDAELGERVKILDFGIAKLSTASVTGTGSLGTPAYMAPEQWNNAATADHRADLYSLGCVLFEMCCGRPPFVAASPGEACTKHLTEPPPRTRMFAPALPIELDDLIDGLLAKRADDRPTLTDVDRVLTAAAVDAPRVIRQRPRASGPVIRASSTGNRGSARDHAAGIAETATSTIERAPAATVTSLAGAVMARTMPPPAPKRRFVALAGGVLAGGAVAAAITFAVTRKPDAEPIGGPQPTVEAPQLGLSTTADYRDPTPATVGNQRSEQVWIGARDSYARACKLRPVAQWCAGEQFAIGELALIRDDVPTAVAAFEAAVTLDPSWSTAHLGSANALSYARKLEPALAAARKAQELEPAAWQPAAASARAYIATGAVDEALIEYRRALALSPKDNVLLIAEVALAYHFALKDDEAERYAVQASALDKSLVAIELIRAERALEANTGQPALEAADRALAISPKNGAALIARGDALALLGQRDEALAAYRHASKLRGGKNILAISEPRLAVIEAAIANGELPVSRSHVRTTSAGSSQPLAASPSGRTSPVVHPGSTSARGLPNRASADAREERSPAAIGNSNGDGSSEADVAPPVSAARTPPTESELPRSKPGGDSRTPRAEDRSRPSQNKPPPSDARSPPPPPEPPRTPPTNKKPSRAPPGRDNVDL